MMEKYKYIFGLVLLIIILLSSYFLGRSSKNCNDSVQTIIKRDTVIVVKQSEPIIIEKAKTKIVYTRDTIIQTQPFIAVVDTIIKKDTVYAKFEFPVNNFDLWIKKKPDSTLIQTITITKEITKDRPWWEASAYSLGGAVIGFLLGKTVK
jgi:hypothetical protein